MTNLTYIGKRYRNTQRRDAAGKLYELLPTGQLVSIAFAWLLPLSKHQAKFTIDADPTVRIKRTGSEPR